MARKTNQETLNQIRENATEEFKSYIPEATSVEGKEVLEALNQYPTARNEFINTLTNKVVMTLFYDKVFANPLQMLHRGVLEHGYAIEQIFVDMAEKVDFTGHFKGADGRVNTTIEADLIGITKPSVHTEYITKDFAYKYKVSISEPRLRTAFTSATGLSTLIAHIMSSVVSAAYRDEFMDMKKVYMQMAEGKDFEGTKVRFVQPSQVITLPAKETRTDRDIMKTLRAIGGRLSFPSDKYNTSGVVQWNDRSQLVLLTTPEDRAELDVDGLGQLFNMEKGEPMINIIEVDELPKTVKVRKEGDATQEDSTKASGQCKFILFDRDWLQSYDTLFESRTFENGDQLAINTFLHKQGLHARCDFTNLVFICEPKGV